MSDRKVLLVGWDAADWKMVQPLMDQGLMPHVRSLVEEGSMAKLRTLSPALSPMLWTSIATGKRPFKHGIYGFIEPAADGKGVQPVTNLSRKTKAVWNILQQNGKRSIVVGWWPSHPAEPISGVMVSNHYQRAPKSTDPHWPMTPGTVHPPGLAEELAELRFHPLEVEEAHIRPFIPHAEKIDQEKDRRLDSLIRVIADCTTIQSCATHLLETQPWDFAAIYFDAIDHFGHGFMRYHPPKQATVSDQDFEIYQNVVAAGYVYHDMMLGHLLRLAGNDATVILMSDHGFHPDHLRPAGIPAEPAGPAIEHRDYGIFVIRGPGIQGDHLVHGASLLDITPTILTMFGLPIGEDMDGRPLLDVFTDPPPIRRIPSWDEVAGESGMHAPGTRLPTNQSREAIEQLVALGYIEEPSEDSEKAVRKANQELDYNLAMAYMDAGMHGEAAPLLADLYQSNPLEFRYGVQLAMCLHALGMIDDLATLVEHLNTRWRQASMRARLRLREIALVGEQRWQEKEAAKKLEAAATLEDPAEVESVPVGDGDNEAEPLREGTLDAEIQMLDGVEDGMDRSGQSKGKTPRFRMQMFDSAEQGAIRSLFSISRGNPQILDYLAGVVAFARQDPETALERLSHARESESTTPGFHLHTGNAFLELERYEEAEPCYQRVLELDSDNPNGHLGLCRCYLRTNRPIEALEHAQAAVSLKFQFAAAHYFLGLARLRNGDTAGAIESIERAIAQNPNFAEAHAQLSAIHTRAGRTEQAALHDREAAQLQAAREVARKSRFLPDLPKLDAATIDYHLPELPPRAESKLLPPLGTKPVNVASKGSDEAGRSEGKTGKAVSAAKTDECVVIVSGLPRSGTSMMMQMLVAGGLVPWTDDVRTADENNPKGYFELERVKQLAKDNSWIEEGVGKVLKVVAPLLPYLPQKVPYRVIFMQRDVSEIVASQTRMLGRLERKGGELSDEQLRQFLTQQADVSRRLLEAHQVPTLVLDYKNVLAQPAAAVARVAEFLANGMDTDAMLTAIDPSLYRERAAS